MKNILFTLALLVSFSSFGQNTINVNSHPKSKGLNFSIKEPSKFQRNDGKRPNILYNWVKNQTDLENRITISVAIKKMPKEMEMSKKEWKDYLKFEGGINDLTAGLDNVNKQKYIVIESYPGIIFNYSNETQRMEYVRKTNNKCMMLFIDNNAFVLSMSTSKKTNLNEEMFFSMANSIVFPDQYK
jgi:hypothetical protein